MLLHMALFHYFLWLSSTPPSICTTFSFSTNLSVDTEVAFMSWLLGYFHVLVNSAVMNTEVHVSFQIIIFFWIYAQECDCWIIL